MRSAFVVAEGEAGEDKDGATGEEGGLVAEVGKFDESTMETTITASLDGRQCGTNGGTEGGEGMEPGAPPPD